MAQPAIAAYLAFEDATAAAQRKPVGLSETPTAAADYTKWSFDPIKGQYTAYLAALVQQDVAFRGDPPKARLSVQTMTLDGKPYPSVILANCPTLAPTWRAYLVSSGQPVPVPSEAVPPPHPQMVELLYYQGHWGVSKVTGDKSRTCTG